MTGISTEALNALNRLALQIDGLKNKNKSIDTEEEQALFEQEAKSMISTGIADFNENDLNEYKETFGLEITKPEETTTATNPTPIIKKATVQLSDKELKHYQKQVRKSVEQHVKNGVTLEDLMERLTREYSNTSYASVLAEVEQLLNNIQTGLDVTKGKDGVEALKNSLQSNLKNDKAWKDFDKNILDALLTQAKNKTAEHEMETKLLPFYEIYIKNCNGNVNYEYFMDRLKSDLKSKKGLTYTDNSGNTVTVKWNDSYTEEAYAILKDKAKNDAVGRQSARIPDTEGHSNRAVRHEMLDELSEEAKAANGPRDGYQAHAVRVETKPDRKIAARHNTFEDRVEELKSVSKEEIQSGLKENFGQKLNILQNYNAWEEFEKSSYMEEHKNSDGTYNLSELAKAIRKRVGLDYLANRSGNKEISEIQGIISEFKLQTGVNLTEEQAHNFADFLGIEFEGRSRNIKRAFKESALGAALGGLAAFLSPGSKTHYYKKYADLIVNIKELAGSNTATQVTNEISEALTNAGIDIITEENTGKITIKRITDLLIDRSGLNGLFTAFAGYGMQVGMNLLLGMEQDEKACISLVDTIIAAKEITNIDEFKTYIEERYPNKKEQTTIILALADKYEKDGKFDSENFIKAFTDTFIAIAGNDIGNCAEWAGARLYPGEMPQQTPPKQPITTPPKPPITTPPTPPCPDNNCKAEVVQTTIKLDGKDGNPNSINYGWHEIIMMYYSDCLQNHTEKEIRFALRKFNHIPNDFKYVPSGILLPQELEFPDGTTCSRTQKKDVKKGKYNVEKSTQQVKLQNGKWAVYTECKDKDGKIKREKVGEYDTEKEAKDIAASLNTQT